MSLSARLGGLRCPACGKVITYAGMTFIEIYEAKCDGCGKEWQIIKYPDGRTEVKPKSVN